jgi:methionyl-tRNA formyltransferase
MRAAFLGTPAAAVPSLSSLAAIADIALVVTQPDAPRGRSQQPVAPPVKLAAMEWGYRVAQPASHDELLRTMSDAEVDIAVIVAYGRLLRRETLAAVPMGYVNVHFSLLPRWRGAAPVERAILAGDQRTGVTLMVLDEGMDTGPLLAAHETDIDADETGGRLTARLAHDGAAMLIDVLPGYVRGRVTPAPQMASGATAAPRLTPAEAQVTADTAADHAARMIRAFSPRPGAWAMIDGVRTKLWVAQLSDGEVSRGHVQFIDDEPHLGLAGGAVVLRSLQPAGKRAMTGREWAAGRRGRPTHLDDV